MRIKKVCILFGQKVLNQFVLGAFTICQISQFSFGYIIRKTSPTLTFNMLTFMLPMKMKYRSVTAKFFLKKKITSSNCSSYKFSMYRPEINLQECLETSLATNSLYLGLLLRENSNSSHAGGKESPSISFIKVIKCQFALR